MIPLESHGGAEDPSAEWAKAALSLSRNLPGIFLMTDSLETGGSERQFSALAKSLDRGQFRVHLGCIQRKGPFLEGLGDVSDFPLGGSLYGSRSIRARLHLARHLETNNIAIAHAFDFYTNLTLIPAARWARVPIVIGSQRQLGDLLTRKQEWAQARVLRWCDTVVCNSRAATARLMELELPESRLTVIGNGLPAEAFAGTAPALPRVPGQLRVGMIARMNTRAKNHHLFLRMAARLRDRFPALQFALAGDGPLRSDLERQARDLGLEGRVLFLGDRRDVSAVLASIDVSVMPSASESLSNVVLESMAAGVPVVATRVGGNGELITEDRGVLVPPDDDEALAEAVARLLRDAARRATLGLDARAFAQANFTLDHMKKRHEELYRELLEKKMRPRETRLPELPRATKDRMRVAIVAASLRYVGGQSVQADLLARHWQGDSAVEARLIPIDPPLPFPLKWVERVPLLRTMIRQPIYLLDLWQGLREADIAHIFSASYWSFLVAPAPAWMLARLRGKKTVIHYHSGEARDHLRRFRSARAVLKRADRLVVPSGFLVEVFREFGLDAHVIPNVVDLSQFSHRVRRPLRPHLVCTRGFHPYYCVDVVVRAFAAVQKIYPEARLDLVGGGPVESQIRDLVREMTLSDVNFAGVVAYRDMGRCYDQADVFINASRLDNMPVSILEAFASGTPVVSTEPEGMAYVVEHGRTGLLSAPGDAQALAENVIRLLQNGELAERLAANAREQIQRYSWAPVREQWLGLYRNLLSRDAPAAEELAAAGADRTQP